MASQHICVCHPGQTRYIHAESFFQVENKSKLSGPHVCRARMPSEKKINTKDGTKNAKKDPKNDPKRLRKIWSPSLAAWQYQTSTSLKFVHGPNFLRKITATICRGGQANKLYMRNILENYNVSGLSIALVFASLHSITTSKICMQKCLGGKTCKLWMRVACGIVLGVNNAKFCSG